MRNILKLATLALGPLIIASTPPPPPAFMAQAANSFATSSTLKEQDISALLTEDVTMEIGHNIVATGKSACLNQLLSRSKGSTIGFSENYREKPYSLLVVDTYDSIKPNASRFSDPRMDVRSSLYYFNKEGRIDRINISISAGFWMTPDKWLPQ